MGKDLFPMTEAGRTLLFVLSCLESNIGDDGMDGDIKGCMQLRSSFLIDLKRDKSQRWYATLIIELGIRYQRMKWR